MLAWQVFCFGNWSSRSRRGFPVVGSSEFRCTIGGWVIFGMRPILYIYCFEPSIDWSHLVHAVDHPPRILSYPASWCRLPLHEFIDIWCYSEHPRRALIFIYFDPNNRWRRRWWGRSVFRERFLVICQWQMASCEAFVAQVYAPSLWASDLLVNHPAFDNHNWQSACILYVIFFVLSTPLDSILLTPPYLSSNIQSIRYEGRYPRELLMYHHLLQGIAPTLLYPVPSSEDHPVLSKIIHSIRDYYPLWQVWRCSDPDTFYECTAYSIPTHFPKAGLSNNRFLFTFLDIVGSPSGPVQAPASPCDLTGSCSGLSYFWIGSRILPGREEWSKYCPRLSLDQHRGHMWWFGIVSDYVFLIWCWHSFSWFLQVSTYSIALIRKIRILFPRKTPKGPNRKRSSRLVQ